MSFQCSGYPDKGEGELQHGLLDQEVRPQGGQLLCCPGLEVDH